MLFFFFEGRFTDRFNKNLVHGGQNLLKPGELALLREQVDEDRKRAVSLLSSDLMND